MQRLAGKRFQRIATLGERLRHQRATAGIDQDVERDERCRSLPRELVDARLRGMDALEQIVEREGSVDRNHDFAIDHESSRTDLAHDLDDVGEIARERLSRLRNEIDAISITKHEAAES